MLYRHKLKGLIGILLSLWAGFANIFLLPRFDVDTYHDGYIYPMALSTSQGGFPHKDFINLYGPVSAIVSGFWIRVFGPSVFNLRIYGAFLIMLISILTFVLIRRIANQEVALVLTIIWMIGNPLVVHPSLPWVDLHTTALLLIFFWMCIFIKKFTFEWRLTLLGVILPIGVATKISFGIVSVSIIMFVAIRWGMRSVIPLLKGSFIAGFSILLFLYFSGSLVNYVEQTMYFAWQFHDSGKSVRGTINIRSILFGSCFILLVYFLKFENSKFRLWKKYLGPSLFLLSSIVWVMVALWFRKLSDPFQAASNNLGENILNFLKNTPYFPLFASIFVLPLMLVFAALHEHKLRKFEVKDQSILLSAVSGCYIFQLYPNPDPAHIWYIFPVVVVGIISLSSKQAPEKLLNKVNRLVLAPVILALFIINLQYLQINRVYHQESPLKGMMSTPSKVEAIDSTLSLLRKNLQRGPVVYSCMRGLYSVHNNTLYASDYQFVDIKPPYFKSRREAPFTFVCDRSEKEIRDMGLGKVLIFETSSEQVNLRNALYVSKS